MTEDIWERPGLWPFDPAGYVFLARAVMEVGVAMFGERWTGDEPSAAYLEDDQHPLPRAPVLPLSPDGPDEYRAAAAAVREWAPEIETGPPILREARLYGYGYAAGPKLPPMSVEQWTGLRPTIAERHAAAVAETKRLNASARRRATRHNAIAGPKIDRFDAVCQEITKQCEAGAVRTAWAWRIGGALSLISKEWWNIHPILGMHRFRWAQLLPGKPFSVQPPTDDFAFVYLSRQDLDRFITSQPLAAVRVDDLPHLSPYLRVMLAVARKAALSPEHQPSKASIEAEIDALWTGEPLSDRLRSAMATLVREPESKLGRNHPNYRRSGQRRRKSGSG
jgi:hypothetical protein